jgi:sugar lactone lactonase YvrE
MGALLMRRSQLVFRIIFLSQLMLGVFLINTTSAAVNITYDISILSPQNSTMHVRIDISGLEPLTELDLTLTDPVFPEKTIINFKIEDPLGNSVTVRDEGVPGPIWKIVTIGDFNTITVEYDMLQDIPEIGEKRIGPTYAVIGTSASLYKPRISSDQIDNIDMYVHIPVDWDILTNLAEIESFHYKLNSLEEIVDDSFGVARGSCIVAGKMQRRDIYFDGNHMRLAIFNEVIDDNFPVDMDQFATVSETLYRFYTNYYGGKTSSNPTIVLTPFMAGHAGGINILAQCYKGLDPSGSGYEQITYPGNFSHHIAHLWWINALAFTPGNEPEYQLMKEGLNFYTNLISFYDTSVKEEQELTQEWLRPNEAEPMTLSDHSYNEFKYYQENIYGTSADLYLSNPPPGSWPQKSQLLIGVIDYRLSLQSGGSQSISSFMKYLFQKNGGYYFNPDYMVSVNLLLQEINAFSGQDFTDFFNRYVYGKQFIPYEPYYYYDKALAEKNSGNLADAKELFTNAQNMAAAMGEVSLESECSSQLDSIDNIPKISVFPDRFQGTLEIISSVNAVPESPRGLTYDGQYFWIVGEDPHIFRVDANQNIISMPDRPSGLIYRGLASDGSNLWVADSHNLNIDKLNFQGTVLHSFKAPGFAPTGLTFDGVNLWNADKYSDKIYQIDTTGKVVTTFNFPGPSPSGLAYDGKFLWCTDKSENKIYKIDKSGKILASFPGPGSDPTDITFADGRLWVADTGTEKVYQLAIPEPVSIGSTKSQNFTIKNIGTGNLNIGSLYLAGSDSSQFSIQSDGCSGHTLLPLNEAVVVIEFSPTTEGTKIAKLIIPSNDPGSPLMIVPLTDHQPKAMPWIPLLLLDE